MSKHSATKRPKTSSPPQRSARSVIKQVTTLADVLEMPVRVMVARAFHFKHLPDNDPSGLLRRYMLQSERVFLWACDQMYGKPPAHLETTGPGGGPMQLKVVIERVGVRPAPAKLSNVKSEDNNASQHHGI